MGLGTLPQRALRNRVKQRKLGILVAMPQECQSLTEKRIPEGGFHALSDRCVLGVSGAGPDAANRCATRLAEQGITQLMSWGCAAALDPALKPGDLVLPRQIQAADGQTLATDPAWHTQLAGLIQTLVPVNSGDLLESRRIISSASEKQALFVQTTAVALDMESAATARAAKALGLPFLAVRSIVDPASVDIPPSIAAAFDENGVLHVPKMLLGALLKPVDFLGIIRLGRDFKTAIKTLTAIADLMLF